MASNWYDDLFKERKNNWAQGATKSAQNLLSRDQGNFKGYATMSKDSANSLARDIYPPTANKNYQEGKPWYDMGQPLMSDEDIRKENNQVKQEEYNPKDLPTMTPYVPEKPIMNSALEDTNPYTDEMKSIVERNQEKEALDRYLKTGEQSEVSLNNQLPYVQPGQPDKLKEGLEFLGLKANDIKRWYDSKRDAFEYENPEEVEKVKQNREKAEYSSTAERLKVFKESYQAPVDWEVPGTGKLYESVPLKAEFMKWWSPSYRTEAGFGEISETYLASGNRNPMDLARNAKRELKIQADNAKAYSRIADFDIAKVPKDVQRDIESVTPIFEGDNGFNKVELGNMLSLLGQIESQYKTKTQNKRANGTQGPAVSYWQVEPATAVDILKNSSGVLGPKFEKVFSRYSSQNRSGLGTAAGKGNTALKNLQAKSESEMRALLLKDQKLAAAFALAKFVITNKSRVK